MTTKRHSSVRWSPEEDQLLFELRDKNLRIKDIAQQMGRTRMSIDSRLRNMGLTIKLTSPHLKWTQKENTLLAQYFSTTSTKELAKIIGRSPAAVQKRASRLRRNGWWAGILSRQPKPGEDEIRIIKNDNFLHGWNIRPEKRDAYIKSMDALTAIEQAMNRFSKQS